MEGKTCCGCNCHKSTPILLILIALSFLLEALTVIDAATNAIIWPILLGAIGVLCLTKGKCGCCQ